MKYIIIALLISNFFANKKPFDDESLGQMYYLKAFDIINQKKYGEEIPFFIKACEAKNVDGCDAMSFYHNYGIGVEKDYEKVFSYDKKSCDLGGAYGCSSLAYDYMDGSAVKRDIKKAKWYATKGCEEAEAFGCVALQHIRDYKGELYSKNPSTPYEKMAAEDELILKNSRFSNIDEAEEKIEKILQKELKITMEHIDEPEFAIYGVFLLLNTTTTQSQSDKINDSILKACKKNDIACMAFGIWLEKTDMLKEAKEFYSYACEDLNSPMACKALKRVKENLYMK